ncbi:hypothetical protein [Streptomyces roseifaciens]|uniref:hypothetical protein n=1 Tax=Streptomyces roseifaciens TaxID=1488406 RepID=UPI0007C73574|nr:hypothetical protein [Streptomyces roseifaciens]
MSDSLNRASFLDGRRDKERMRAEAWKWDEGMERLAALRDSNPEMFERIGVTTRMSLGYYENDKTAAAKYGRNVNKGGK